MSLKLWQYELVDTRDDVKTEMPDGWEVKVYKVTSGDSGKKYYVQVVEDKDARLSLRRTMTPYYFCNCPEGTFRMPIAVTGGKCCKHAVNLKEFLEDKRRGKK